MTVELAAVLLAESVLRVVVVYGAGWVDLVEIGLAAQLPAILLLLGYGLVVRLVEVPKARAIVDQEVAHLRAVR